MAGAHCLYVYADRVQMAAVTRLGMIEDGHPQVDARLYRQVELRLRIELACGLQAPPTILSPCTALPPLAQGETHPAAGHTKCGPREGVQTSEQRLACQEGL